MCSRHQSNISSDSGFSVRYLLHFLLASTPLQRRIASLEEDIGRASPDSLTLKRAAISLQQQIRAVGGPKFAEAQAKVERIVAQLLLQNKMMVEKEVVETNCRNQVNLVSSNIFMI